MLIFKAKRNRWKIFLKDLPTRDPPLGKVPSISITLFLRSHFLEFCSIYVSAGCTHFNYLYFFSTKHNPGFDSWWPYKDTYFISKHFKLIDNWHLYSVASADADGWKSPFSLRDPIALKQTLQQAVGFRIINLPQLGEDTFLNCYRYVLSLTLFNYKSNKS